MTTLRRATPAADLAAEIERLPGRDGAASATDCLGQGMQCVDTTSNTRIPVLMELVGALSRATEPREVQRIFGEGLRQLVGPRGYISLSTRGLEPGQYRITRLMLDDQPEMIQLADPWSMADSLPIHTGGFLGELIRSAYPELIHNLNVRNDPALGNAIAGYRSLMAVPLFDNGEPLNWSIQLSRDPEDFSIDELEQTIMRANLVGGTVRNTLIAKRLREANERNQREVEQIARIQRALLPQSLPKVPGLSMATSYETFDTAGGDLYDFVDVPRHPLAPPGAPHRLAMLIADASGHGPSAAVMTAMLNAILGSYAGKEGGPADVLEYANRHLFGKRIEGTFITAFLGLYDPNDKSLTYASAGHPPVLLKNAGSGGAVARLDGAGGVPLGIIEDARFEQASITLHSGQTMVLYTDGITEAMNRQRRMFGVAGIERALHDCSGEPACVVNSIRTALKEHEEGLRPSDDQTIVAVKVE